MAGLTASEIETYRRDGLVAPSFRLDEARLRRLAAAVERLVAANPDVPPEYLIGPHVPRPGDPDPDLHREFLDLCLDPAILDLVESAIGPDVILWSSGVFCKPPRTGRAVPWHQDGRYWPLRPLATCSVWVAVDDSRPENGCLRYIPGSHAARRLYRHEHAGGGDLVLNRRVSPSEFDPAAARDDVLRAGQLSLHDVYLVHGSNPNRTGRRRAGYVMRYLPGTSFYDREMEVGQSSDIGVSDFAMRPIWLACGVDRTGRNDFRTGHPPEEGPGSVRPSVPVPARVRAASMLSAGAGGTDSGREDPIGPGSGRGAGTRQ